MGPVCLLLLSINILLISCNGEKSVNSSNVTTTLAPTNTPTNTPTLLPTNSPLVWPSQSPTSSPSISPISNNPTSSPTNTPTNSPLQIFTTEIGPNINPRQQLIVNFSLNFTCESLINISVMNTGLLLAYSMVNIPSNYIHNKINFVMFEQKLYYFCNVFTSINAKDKSEAYSYEDQINSDPPKSFGRYLKQILNADKFDISTPKMDIVSINTKNDNNSNTTQIIIWFLGVCAVIAIGALLLIICWKKYTTKDENDNDNAINLEFLLDPNAPMDANQIMHINNTNPNNNMVDIDNDEDLKPITQKTKKK
eukprot:832551_1